MGRKNKTGLDYFPHSCSYNDKLKYILALHGAEGYKIFFELLRKIYSEEGYFMNASRKVLALFASEINVNIDSINAVIKDCLSEHLFDKGLHRDYNILTSKSIQENYFDAIRRRKTVDLVSEYILVDNVSNYFVNADINFKNVNKNQQSRGEYRRVKDSKVEDKKGVNVNINSFNVNIYTLFDKCVIYFPEKLRPQTDKQKYNWLDTIDKLIRIDGFTEDQIEYMVSWAREHNFWAKNFLSLKKLRQKNKQDIRYADVFVNQIKSEKKSKNGEREKFEQFING